MADRWYSTYQVADLLGTKAATVAQWAREGLFVVERLPDGTLQIPEKSLLEFLQRQGIDIEGVMAKTILRHEIAQRLQHRDGPAARVDSSPSPALPSNDTAPAVGEATRQPQVKSPELADGATPRPEQPAGPDAQQDAQPEGQPAISAPPPPTVSPPEALVHGAHTTPAPGPGEPPSSPPAITPSAPSGSTHTPPAVGPDEPPNSPQPQGSARPGAEDQPTDPIEQVTDAILRDAVASRASHIHLDWTADGLVLRLRTDGALHTKPNFALRLPENISPRLIEHFMAMANQAAGSSPAGFTRAIAGRTIEFQLASLETIPGRKLVITVADPQAVPDRRATLDLPPADRRTLRSLLAQPFGLVAVAGATTRAGSSLLRTMTGELDAAEQNVIWIGNPGPIRLEGVHYCPVAATSGPFRDDIVRIGALADPDVLVIGDVSGRQAAASAVTAATKGLVLAGVNAVGPARALSMLAGSVEDGWTLGAALLAIVHLRTVRRLCRHCGSRKGPSGELLGRLGLAGSDVPSQLPAAIGCSRCSNTGYAGTAGVISILRIDGPIVDLLCRGASGSEIAQAARQAETASIRSAAMEKLNAGATTLEELARVLPAW